MNFTAAHARTPAVSDEGTDWLYIVPGSKRLLRVEIVVVPDGARKVRIQHLERDQGGKTEWVPVGRLKVPWRLRERYMETAATWERAEKHAPSGPVRDIALQLFPEYVDEAVADIYYNGAGGILEIFDLPALARISGMSEDKIRAHEDTFDEEATYVPWPTLERILRKLCKDAPHAAMQLYVTQRHYLQGYTRRQVEAGDPWWVDPYEEDRPLARKAERWRDDLKVGAEFLRSLLDADEPGLADDFIELKRMYLETIRLLPRTVDRLRMNPAQRSQMLADELERHYGRPLPRSAEVLGDEE